MADRAFDIIVIGGGHAGAEAAWAAARIGARTALVSHTLEAIGRMSCNPAIGGIGKGQIVREVDALGGLMGLVTDETGIQFRMLNRRKGPAVWAPRAQADRELYAAALRLHLETCPNLTLVEAGVDDILTEPTGNGLSPRRVTGVQLGNGDTLRASAVILASGTFLRGLMHTGTQQTPGGRIGEPAATTLSDALRRIGLTLGRLKTGTPPRLAPDSIDFARLQEQAGDAEPAPFSFLTDRIDRPQVCCWLTATNAEIHELIRANLHRAPLFTGQIGSTGPRYCPSIETKIERFPDKTSHQVFLEPEGLDRERIYVNGISTSLPVDVQREIVARIPGLEHARVVQWGYAIEYDFAPPEQLEATLETRCVRGLYLAGQICGTSGYEEAAGQGIVAGINAARAVAGRPPVVIGRDQGYIGVMIDDLVTRGVMEPYRMFTSRAEHRMHLRYDNADERLTPLGRAIGLVDNARWMRYERRAAMLGELLKLIYHVHVDGRPLCEWLKRPEEDGRRFLRSVSELDPYRSAGDIWNRALVAVKYEGYIRRQQEQIERFRALENRKIPSDIDFRSIPQLRNEAAERWSTVRPRCIGQAARVSGVHPTDVSLLLVHLAGMKSAQSNDNSFLRKEI